MQEISAPPAAAALDSEAASLDREQRFEAFVASHRDRAVRLAWRLLDGDAAAAEDVAQDAFVRAYRALPRFRGEASLATWFYRILVRRAHSHRRWRAVRERWAGPSQVEATDPRAAALGDPLLRRRIGQALERLSRRQREVFVLVHLDGFTVREAAGILRMPTGTLKSHLHRALRGLRRELRDVPDSRDSQEGVCR
jgi:RNA polymerase sigma-70 factor (ECF subfamily)